MARSPQGPAGGRALDPPPRFRGAFLRDADALNRYGTASGPFRHPLVAVARPRDEEDVAKLVVWAGAHGVPLIPRGAGTGMPGGNVGPGVAVDLTGFTDLGAPDPGARTLTAGVGVTAGRLNGRAQDTGLFFPALPSSADRCTVGGIIANNAAGARSFRYGAVRPWVEEVRGVLADGSLMTLRRGDVAPTALRNLHKALCARLGGSTPPWPEVAKNSSGYALDAFLPTGDAVDLLVGSEGTLAMITSARLRLAPLPNSRALVLIPLPHPTLLPQAVATARQVGAAACEFFGRRFLDLSGLRTGAETADVVGDAPALLMMELQGEIDEVEAHICSLATFAADLGVSLLLGRSKEERARLWVLRHAASPVVAAQADHGLVSMQFIEDSVVRVDRLPTYLAGLDAILEEERTDAVVFGHAGDGNVHVNPLVDVRLDDWRETVRRILEATVDLVATLGGTLSGEHGDGRLRGTFHERIFGFPMTEAFHDVKETLDPLGVLNPGVIVPRPGQDPLEGLTAIQAGP